MSVMRAEYCGSHMFTLLDSLLCNSSLLGGGGIAVEDTEGRKLSYEDFARSVMGFAGLLAESYGIEPGDEVVIAPLNTVESLVAIYGAWAAGATVVIIDAASPAEDVAFQLSMVNAKLFLTYSDNVSRHCFDKNKCLVLEKAYLEAREKARPREPPYRPRPWERALTYFYAGIAGRTLPVNHTHAGLASSAAITASHFNLGPNDRSFVSAPISHALGLQISTLSVLFKGGTAVLYSKRGRLDAADAAAKLASSRATIVLGAPGFYQALLNAGYKGHEGLKYAVSAGAPLPLETQREWRAKTGVELLQLYGMTEAAPLTATKPDDNPAGSIGKPMPGVELKLIDLETGRETWPGPGEAVARAPNIMESYGDTGETSKAIRGGWLFTGDILAADEHGNLYFKGVRKRMLKYKGYPVFPRDLEILLEQHPLIARAEVYGVPSEHGQEPAAKVWLKPGASITPEEIMEWVNKKVASYKKIRHVTIIGTASS